MKKTMLKRILGLLVLIFVFTIIGLPNVHAEEVTVCKKADKFVSDNGGWQARYGIELDYDGNYYYITMNISDDLATEFKNAGIKKYKDKVKFAITGIVNYTPAEPHNKYNKDSAIDADHVGSYIVSENKELTNGSTVKIDAKRLGYSLQGVEISLDPEGFDDPTVLQYCKEKSTFHMDVNFEAEGSPYETPMDKKWKTDKKDLEVGEAINCDNYTSKFDKISFEYGFCEAKVNASKKKTFKENESYSEANKEAMKFTCNPNNLFPAQNLDNVNDEVYYRNRKYLYGVTTKEVASTTYRHNYENGYKKDTTDKAVCKLQCEESVVVEFGPPVAAKAAFCFQYKVKVTSRVSCSQAEGSEVKQPNEDSYCTPSPYCVHSNGTVYKQGGPNEAFDACVKSCDGGKYTKKCTNKCYDKVYGKNKNKVSKTTGSEVAYAQKLNKTSDGNVEKLDSNIDCSSCSTCPTLHYCYNGSQIIWQNGANGDVRNCNTGNHVSGNWYSCSTDSRWHQDNSWGCTGNYGYYSDTGIPRTGTCSDKCSWIGCKNKGYYLNPDTLNEDAKWNKEEYERIVRECKAAASCTSKTAYFTISVDYRKTNDQGKIEDVTVDFPYSETRVKVEGKDKDEKFTREAGGDRLVSKGKDENNNYSSDTDTSGKANTTLIKGNICTTANMSSQNKTWLRHYCSRGCYESEGEKDLYRAEWTFPGTWENLKSGEISYKPKSGGTWTPRNKYFCVPADAQDVNTEWYNYYMARQYGKDKNFAANSVTDYKIKIEDACYKKTCEYKYINETNFESSKVEAWNIRALARSFGYFEWNIDIKCFYAVNNQKKNPTCKEQKNCAGKTTESYRVRSVDLKNLFPGKDGTAVNYDTTGRAPGFNWSKFATQGGTNDVKNETKDASYISQPSEYTKWVQKKGYTVYEDANLDYMVTIDKDSIRELKSHLKEEGVKFTKFDGNIIDQSNTSHYRSELFSNSNKYKLKNVVYPGTDALKCNNIGEHTSGAGYGASCQTYN